MMFLMAFRTGLTSYYSRENCRTTWKLQVKVPVRLSFGFTITSPDFLHPPCRRREAHQNTVTLTFLFRQQQDLEDMDALVQISRSPAQTIEVLTFKFLSYDEWVSLSLSLSKKIENKAPCCVQVIFCFCLCLSPHIWILVSPPPLNLCEFKCFMPERDGWHRFMAAAILVWRREHACLL